jgi:hypothetical protein
LGADGQRTNLQYLAEVLKHGIEIGRGGFWIELNEKQYQAQRRPKS